MAAPAAVAQVVGIRALARDLARMGEPGSPLLKAMVDAGRKAAEPVASVTRGTLPRDSGRLAGDVRVSATKSGAAVRMGRASIRYAGWVEFGGTRRVPHTSRRQYDPRGRYLFPAAVQIAPTAARLYSEAVNEIFANYKWSNSGDDPGGVHD